MRLITSARLLAAIVALFWSLPLLAQQPEEAPPAEEPATPDSDEADRDDNDGSGDDEDPAPSEDTSSDDPDDEDGSSEAPSDLQLPEPVLDPTEPPPAPPDVTGDLPPPLPEEPAPDETNPPTAPEPPSSLPETPLDSGSDDELSLSDWESDDWTLLQPELSLVELNGYFRVRSQFFRRLNFGNGDLGAEDPSRFEVNEEIGGDREDVNLNGTDMRVRFEPIINITEQVQVVTTVDVFDNLVLGSTPLTLPFSRSDEDDNGDPDLRDTPVNLLNRSQQQSVSGVNAVRDSIVVRRAYARLTALNDQLQFDIGRMPDHWGLGMMINSGDCLDCDFGDVVDRAIVGFKAVGHLFQVGFTLVDSGPTTAPFYDRLGPVYDLARWDDVDQYDIRVQKIDHPDDIKERVLLGETVFNYGLLTAIRLQNDGLNFEYFETDSFDPTAPLNTEDTVGDPIFVREERNGLLFIGDAFVRVFSGPWTFEAEAATMLGNFDDLLLDESLTETDIQMWGGHAQLAYAFNKAPRSGAILSFHGGAASGDRGQSGEEGRGFGAFDRIDTQRGGDDDKLSAFQFSPDFHVDQLLFRRVIGTVIDAWYAGPRLQYFFDEAVEGRAAVNYSQTWFKRNVPGDDLPLGLEIDTAIIFGAPSETASGGEIFASAEAAILFPFSGFDAGNDGGGSFAWSLQAKLFLTF